jgi:hypothetical protein
LERPIDPFYFDGVPKGIYFAALSTSSLPVAPLKERVAYEFKLILMEQCKKKRANWSTS